MAIEMFKQANNLWLLDRLYSVFACKNMEMDKLLSLSILCNAQFIMIYFVFEVFLFFSLGLLQIVLVVWQNTSYCLIPT